MSKSSQKKRRERRRAQRRERAIENGVSPFRPDGTADYTTFSALTGKELISKSRPSELKQKMPGGFNG